MANTNNRTRAIKEDKHTQKKPKMVKFQQELYPSKILGQKQEYNPPTIQVTNKNLNLKPNIKKSEKVTQLTELKHQKSPLNNTAKWKSRSPSINHTNNFKAYKAKRDGI